MDASVSFRPNLKFLFTRFLPEVLIHSREQDVRIARGHDDRGNDRFNRVRWVGAKNLGERDDA